MKKRYYYALLSIIVTLTLLNCNKSKAITEKENNSDLIDSSLVEDENFQSNLINKPKLFLKYWSGMSEKEFNKVSEILENEGVVKNEDGVSYLIGDETLKVNLFFSQSDYISCIYKQDESVSVSSGINLWGFNENKYNLFKQKYNLPNYIIKKSAQFILEDNPIFNSNDNENKVGENPVYLKERDVIDFIGGIENKFNYPPNLFENYTRVTVPYNIVREKDDVVVLFEDVKDVYNPITFEGEYDSQVASFFYLNNDKKSKKRIVKISNFSSLRVTYIPKSYYYDMIQSNKAREENDLKEKIKNKKNKEIRSNQLFDEI